MLPNLSITMQTIPNSNSMTNSHAIRPDLMENTLRDILKFVEAKLQDAFPFPDDRSSPYYPSQHNYIFPSAASTVKRNSNPYGPRDLIPLDQVLQKLDALERKLDNSVAKSQERISRLEAGSQEQEFASSHLIKTVNDINNKMTVKSSDFEKKLDQGMDFIARNSQTLNTISRKLNPENFGKSVALPNQSGRNSDQLIVTKLENIELQINKLEDVVKNSQALIVKQLSRHDTIIRTSINHLNESANNTLMKVHQLLEEQSSSEPSFTSSSSTPSPLQDAKKKVISSSNQQSSRNMDDVRRDVTPSSLIQSPSSTESRDYHIVEHIEGLEQSISLNQQKIEKIDSNIEVYTKKVINNILELWKSTNSVEMILNKTSLAHTLSLQRIETFMMESSVKFSHLTEQLAKFTGGHKKMEEKMTEIKAALYNSHEAIMLAQNSMMTSCYRIQQEETQLYDMIDFRLIEMNETMCKTDLINKLNTDSSIGGHSQNGRSKMESKLQDIEQLLEKVIKKMKDSHEFKDNPRVSPSHQMVPFIVPTHHELSPPSSTNIDHDLTQKKKDLSSIHSDISSPLNHSS